MGKWFDIFISPEGIAITIFKFIQIAVYYLKTNEMESSGTMYNSKAIDISLSIWKVSTHMHFVLAERNLCQDVQIAKS